MGKQLAIYASINTGQCSAISVQVSVGATLSNGSCTSYGNFCSYSYPNRSCGIGIWQQGNWSNTLDS